MLRQGSRIVTVMVLVEILTSLALGATATAHRLAGVRAPARSARAGAARPGGVRAGRPAGPARRPRDRPPRPSPRRRARAGLGDGDRHRPRDRRRRAVTRPYGRSTCSPSAWGVGNAFVGPTLGPLLAAGVAAENLSQTFAMVTSAGQAAMIAGPAIGGITQTIGAPAPYLFAAACSARRGGAPAAGAARDRRRPRRRPRAPARATCSTACA